MRMREGRRRVSSGGRHVRCVPGGEPRASGREGSSSRGESLGPVGERGAAPGKTALCLPCIVHFRFVISSSTRRFKGTCSLGFAETSTSTRPSCTAPSDGESARLPSSATQHYQTVHGNHNRRNGKHLVLAAQSQENSSCLGGGGQKNQVHTPGSHTHTHTHTHTYFILWIQAPLQPLDPLELPRSRVPARSRQCACVSAARGS